jgi:predicted transcriptional regulator
MLQKLSRRASEIDVRSISSSSKKETNSYGELLLTLGLVERKDPNGNSFRITKKGRAFLNEYLALARMLT